MEKQSNTFSLVRVGHLLRYDWVIDRSRYRTTLIIVVFIYVAFVMMSFVRGSSVFLDMAGTPGVESFSAAMVGSYVMNYFGFVATVMVIVATVALHRKFTNPQTATAYLALPGTRAEKATAQVLHYAIVCLSTWILYLVAFYVTMIICQLRFPEGVWFDCNPFSPMGLDTMRQHLDASMNEVAAVQSPEYSLGYSTGVSMGQKLAGILHAMQWTAPFQSIAIIALYAVLNMNFRHNGQLKVIAIFVGIYVFLVIGAIVGLSTTAFVVIDYASAHGMDVGDVFVVVFDRLLTVVNVLLWSVPIVAVALVAWFYRKVARKQAK